MSALGAEFSTPLYSGRQTGVLSDIVHEDGDVEMLAGDVEHVQRAD